VVAHRFEAISDPPQDFHRLLLALLVRHPAHRVTFSIQR
jgi:hypothetical protein